jgi:hypothetical protein
VGFASAARARPLNLLNCPLRACARPSLQSRRNLLVITHCEGLLAVGARCPRDHGLPHSARFHRQRVLGEHLRGERAGHLRLTGGRR